MEKKVNVKEECADCNSKLRVHQPVISCALCYLDFHVSCTNVDFTEKSNWWCDSCFFKIALAELPFNDYISHDSVSVNKVAHNCTPDHHGCIGKDDNVSSNYNVFNTISQNICAICTCKITTSQPFISCIQCSLDFHINCLSIDHNYTSGSYWCDSCFYRTCLDELPFCNDHFIDFNCKVSKGFTIAHLNIRSLRGKVDHLRILLNQNNIDVLCLTETWLNDSVCDNEVFIDGYNLCRLDRIFDMEHGGILCYVKDGIVFKERCDLHNDDIEALWIEITLPHTKPLLLGTVYRQPDSKADYLDKLDHIFQDYTSSTDDVIIVGDFNLDICKKK